MSVVQLANDRLLVEVNPNVGGTITRVHHHGLGMDVLGEVPWVAINAPLAGLAARDEPEWLTRYTGGWPLLFPNGGDACEFGGVFHGFHGEASIAPWLHERNGAAVRLTRDFAAIPARMERVISLEGESLHVSERLHFSGNIPAEAMWGHHPSFGRDLLDGPFEITAGARRITADSSYDPPFNPFTPGSVGAWPVLEGKAGRCDVSHLASPAAALAYLDQFETAWAAIRRLDNSAAAVLSWDAELFPCAWLWFELNGTADAPWCERTRLIGIEPNTTRQAAGIADAKQRGAALLKLMPEQSISTELRLTVFKPQGPLLHLPAGMGIKASSTQPDFPP